MSETLSTADRTAIESLVSTLEAAWNAGDGDAFGAPFAADADFVNVRAEHHHGRTAIAAGHVAILRTIYAGSKNRYTLESARLLRDDVALVHVSAELEVPAGPLAGRIRAGSVDEGDLALVQRARELPIRIIQAIQAFIQGKVVGRALNTSTSFKPPAAKGTIRRTGRLG